MGCHSSGNIGGGSSAGITTAQSKEINRIANRTRNLKKEQYRIVNEDGEVVLQKQGKEHEVAATVGEKREYMSGAVSIHNHPNGGTFSYDDMSDFGYGARGIVASAPEGDYKLTNIKYGTKSQYEGWKDMQDAMETAGVTKELSYTDLRKQAQKNPQIAKMSQKASKLSSKWLEAKNSGKPQSELDKISSEYTKASNTYKAALHSEMRRLETKPYDDFYRKNAKKYGFKYEFVKK